jgi:dienelactone hydrolase
MDEAARPLPVEAADVDGIPVIWVRPQQDVTPRRLVIFLIGFSGLKERVEPYLQDLARAGFIALSFDLWQHGSRGTETKEQIVARVFANFRRYMWPIIGQTALDATRVIDWAVEQFGVAPEVAMGGISLGGDISLAAAGLDTRIRRVAAIIATPDWLRPGMRRGNPPELLPPGTPDSYARFFYDRLNPITHLEAFAQRPAITFELGADDTHVPPEAALRFEAALRQRYPDYGDDLRVTLHLGCGHEVIPAMWDNCLAWFLAGISTPY